MNDKKERLKELLALQKQKTIDEEEKRAYDLVVEEMNTLFPNGRSEEVVFLSKEDSDKIVDEFFEAFPFSTTGIDWTLMFHKTIFSNYIDYESALAELVLSNHKEHHAVCYIIDLNAQHVMKTNMLATIHRVEEVRRWDKYIYVPKLKLVIDFPSNDIAVGWKV